MLEFKSQWVAKHFAATVEKDRTVIVPGTYTGPLSGIGIKAAKQMLAEGVDLLKPTTSEEEVTAAEIEENKEAS